MRGRRHSPYVSPNTNRLRSNSTIRTEGGGSTAAGGNSATNDTVDDPDSRKRCICGPYLDLIAAQDTQDMRDARTGRFKKSPDLKSFSSLRLTSLDLDSVVEFVNRYEEKRGNHPDLIFKITAFCTSDTLSSPEVAAANAGWDLSVVPGNSVAHLDDTDVRALLHKEVAAKSIDDFITKVQGVKFYNAGGPKDLDIQAYGFEEFLKQAMKYATRFRTLAEVIAVEAKPAHVPYVHKTHGVRGLVDYFLDGFPKASSGNKTIGRLLYEKLAYSNPELKTKVVLRDWLFGFFKVITPYRDIKTMTDDLNAIILRHDLIHKTPYIEHTAAEVKVASPSRAPDKSAATPGTASTSLINVDKQRKFTGRVNHVRFEDNTTANAQGESSTDSDPDACGDRDIDSEAVSRIIGEGGSGELLAAVADANKHVAGCHKKFQFGTCTDPKCQLDHSEDGLRRLYLKRIWDLAKATYRPDPSAVMRNLKHALEEIESQQARAGGPAAPMST